MDTLGEFRVQLTHVEHREDGSVKYNFERLDPPARLYGQKCPFNFNETYERKVQSMCDRSCTTKSNDTEVTSTRDVLSIQRTIQQVTSSGRVVSTEMPSLINVPMPSDYEQGYSGQPPAHSPIAAQIEEFLWGLGVKLPGRKGFNGLNAKNKELAEALQHHRERADANENNYLRWREYAIELERAARASKSKSARTVLKKRPPH